MHGTMTRIDLGARRAMAAPCLAGILLAGEVAQAQNAAGRGGLVPPRDITGSIPHPYNRPEGCPFHTRCPDFMAGTCDVREPALRPIAPDHQVSCFLYHD